ncbi:MAG TPA: amidohydrolase family protein [Acidimicrobiales bacterium]|nr:amidohydrolase family protein [Acidimicrobiales bacterium]
MLFDSHCHAWRKWPYSQGVPDPDARGSVDTLLWEMDENGVDRAAVVCVRMGREVSAACANDDNNDYVAVAVKAHPDRLVMLADIDCFWTDAEYHKPGASERLKQAAERYELCAFTHYVDGDNDGWLVSEEGQAFFATAARLNLVASLAVPAPWFADLRQVALANPTMPILLHHLGMLRLESPTLEADIAALVRNADLPNLYIKLSGLHYLSEHPWDFPFLEVQERVFCPLLAAFGAERFVWGSDFSAAGRYISYPQSLEVVRRRLDGLSAGDINLVLGETLESLLRTRRPRGQQLQKGAG